MGQCGNGLHAVLFAFILLFHTCLCQYRDPIKFLIVSDAANGVIGYLTISPDGTISSTNRTLISTGLKNPQGIAVDQKRMLLFIADSGIEKVVSYGLSVNSDSLSVDEQTTVAQSIASRWVAVDSMGNVFFTDEAGSRILRFTAQQIQDGNTHPEVLLTSTATNTIASPGGIASDNYFVYWTNKRGGQTIGAVSKALISTATTPAVNSNLLALANNLDRSYGLCLATDNVFYTAAAAGVFVTKKTGGTPAVQVANTFSNPRGCVWDGQSRVFIADRTAGAVFSVPGPMFSLTQQKAIRIANFTDAFGLALVSAAQFSQSMQLLSVVVLSTAAYTALLI